MIPSVRLDFRPSHRIAGFLGAVHIAALCSAVISIDGWPLTLTIAGVAVSSLVTIFRALKYPPGSVYALALLESGTVSWCDRSGEWRSAIVAKESCVLSWLIVLELMEESAHIGAFRRWMLICPDSSSIESMRILRVWLRGRPDPRPA